MREIDGFTITEASSPDLRSEQSDETTDEPEEREDGLETIRHVFNDLRSGVLLSRPVPLWSTKEARCNVTAQVSHRAQRSLEDASTFMRMFKKLGHWVDVERVTMELLEQYSSSEPAMHSEPILGRLKPASQRVRDMLQAAIDTTEKDVEPTNPHEMTPYSLISWDKEHWYSSLEEMKQGGHELVELNRQRGGVTLNTRAKQEGILHAGCEGIKEEAEMEAICPQKTFSFGPPLDNADPRYYMIVAFEEALTRAHCDRGAQVVLYHTHQGMNRFIGIPSRCATLIQVASESLCSKHFEAFEESARIEGRALRLLGTKGLLQYGELGPGETLLILPRAGHAVLAGEHGKTVYAGEWWHRTVGEPRKKKSKRKRTKTSNVE